MPEVTAVYQKQIWRSSEEGNDFCIAAVKLEDGQELTVLGNAQDGKFISGVQYRFSGKFYFDDKRQEEQFRFQHFVQLEPLTKRGIVKYLEKYAEGIGPAIAFRLWDEYGSDAVKMLRLKPDACAMAISILHPSAAIKASKSLVKIQDHEDTKIELTNLFAGRGFSSGLFEDVMKAWGCEAPNVIRRDPFKMLVKRFKSVSFNRADQLYMDLGHDPGKLKRQMLFIWNFIESDSSGDTWKSYESIVRAIQGGISETKLKVEKAIRLGLRAGWLEMETIDGNRWLSTKQRAMQEQSVADKIQDLQEFGFGKGGWPDVDGVEGITEHQRGELRKATSGKVGVLLGSAGTGKTWTLAKMLKYMLQSGANNVAISAPTGKASVRLTEYLSQFGLSLQACTIHRLLGVTRSGRDGDGWGFTYNSSNRLPFRYVVVDESSMVSTSLMASLITALNPSAHLLLIGDIAQLLPVDHGCPLRDIVNAGLPSGELTEIQRNSGEGVRLCHRIRNGESYVPPSGGVDIPAGRNVIHIEAKRASIALAAVRRILGSVPEGIDPMWDVQIIAPLNSRGRLCRKELSGLVQSMLNPRKSNSGSNGSSNGESNGQPNGETEETINLGNDREMRLDDKVICTENNWMVMVDAETFVPLKTTVYDKDGNAKEDFQTDFVANGEIGKVVRIARVVINAKGDTKLHLYVSFEVPKRTVVVSGEQLFCFDLAGCVTCHKMQGSQAKYVIYVADDNPAARMIGSRQLVYTALSRFEKAVFVVGSEALIRQDCGVDALSSRKTLLMEKISGSTA